MENQTSPYEQYIPRLILQFMEELATGLEPFEDKDKIIIIERITPFAQARCDGQQNLRTLYENTFLWIVRTYRKKAKQLIDSNLQDSFFNGSMKFFPELKQADAPQDWLGFQLDEAEFDEYLTLLALELMKLRENLYLTIEPESEKEPEEVRVQTLNLKQTALYFYYLDRGYYICEDKKQLAYIASQVSGYNKDNLYKKILNPIGTDLRGEQSRKHLERDILTVKKLFECSGKELGIKYINGHLSDIKTASGKAG